MIFTVEQLNRIIPGNEYVNEWYTSLSNFLTDYQIDSIPRVAAFLAQTAHESGNYKFISENLNYRWESLRKTFPKYFPTDDLSKQYARQPEKIANRVYANRMGNESEESGDGWLYRGRGLIQLTGKNNYKSFGEDIGLEVNEVPDYLTTFDGAVHSACWFWNKNSINTLADAADIRKITRVINGGTNGLEDRIERYRHALNVLNA